MREIILDEDDPISAVHVRHLDNVGLRVTPVDLPLLVIDHDAVGPGKVCVDDCFAVRAIQVGPLDFWLFSPVCPPHETVEKPFGYMLT